MNITQIKTALHLAFAAALLFCFAGAALSHFRQGHHWLSLCFLTCGGFYVSQAAGRLRASLRPR